MPNEILTRAIDEVASGSHLTADHASAVLDEVMEGRAGEVQTGAFLIALRAKGETVAELVGLARTMRRLSAVGRDPCATTSSTPRAPAAAPRRSTSRPRRRSSPPGRAARLPSTAIARAPAAPARPTCSRRSGCRSTSGPTRSPAASSEIGFGFMFAPRHHAAMKHVVPVRRELAVRTIFNFLGPLTNPAGASRQLLGVSDRRYQETIAEALVGLGCERALVVSSDDGVDEISVADRTRVIEVADGGTEEWFVTPEDLGIAAPELQHDRRRRARPRTRPRFARCSTASRDRPATWSSLNAAAAILAGGGAHDLPAGARPRARGDRLGRRAWASSSGSSSSAASWRRDLTA